MNREPNSRQASLGAQVLLLTQEFGQFKTNFVNFQGEIREWMSSQRGTWRGAWPVIVTVGGFLWFVLNLQITSSTRQVDDKSNRGLSLAELTSVQVGKLSETIPTIIQQNATSKQDREDQRILSSRMLEVQTEMLKAMARETAERVANEREVETQIDSMSQMFDIQFAEQQRKNADVQNTFHDMGAKWPQAAPGPWVVPNISNRSHKDVIQ